ncbi:MAG: hypothetical protein OEX07_05655, partial [Gammaproteobacteria bacterium]|nr:hypothetical protein [Gammaproteobacteria bacterium]
SYDEPRWENILREKRISNQQLSMQILNYYPGNGVSGRNSKVHEDVLSTLGIRFSHKLNRLLWGEFETAGAMGGGIDGFAQVLGGFSLKHMLFSKVGLSTGWLLGAAGGGNVDTGGGMITRVYTGVEYFLFRRWSTYLQFGYTTTPDGGFYAKTMNLNIVYNFSDFSYKTHLISQKESGRIKWRNLRIRPGVQKYTFYDKPSRKFPHQKDLDVDLTNLKLDAFFNTRWYFTGQALGAFRGKAGGYAVGLIGPGVQINRYIGFELPIGVAGGGGIAVGSGKIVQPMLNFELPHSRSWASELSAGYIKAMDDSLSAFVFNIGLVYRFSRPYI